MKKIFFYQEQSNPLQAYLKKKNETEIKRKDDEELETYFKDKESNKYDIIQIQGLGLMEKTENGYKEIKGRINLFDYEYGGPIIERKQTIHQLLKSLEQKNGD